MKTNWWPWGILSVISIALAAYFILYPLATLLINSLQNESGQISLDGFVQLIEDSTYREAFINTLTLGVIVTGATVLIGVPFAYMVARFDFPFKNLIAVLPVVTIVIPEIIVGQSWLMVFGNNGLLTNALEGLGIEVPSFYGWIGMIFSMTLVYYMYIYLGVLAALRGFDSQLEEAGLSLGTTPLSTKLKVLVPVILPAVLANALVVFTLVIGNFALSILLGGRVPLLSIMTYNAFLNEMGGSPVLQSTMSVVSIGIVAIALYVQKRVVERKNYAMTQGRTHIAVRVKSWPATVFVVLMSSVVLLSMLPLMIVFIAAFTKTSGPVMKWGSWSVENLLRVLSLAPEPVLNSLKFASLATLLGVSFAVIISYLVIKKKSYITQLLDYLTALPLTISGTILGIALVQTYNDGPVVLTGTAIIMVLCYTIRKLPFALRNASSTLFNIPDSIEEASLSLGVPPLKTFVKVVLPAMRASAISAAILMWVTTISELSASIVVYTGGFETMPIAIFRQVDGGRLGIASAYGAVLVSVIILPIFVAIKVFRINLFSSK